MIDSPDSRAAPRSRHRHVVVAGVVVVGLLVSAFFVDRGRRAGLMGEAQDEVTRQLTGYGAALQLAMAEYTVLVEALAAWIERNPDASRAEFEQFAGTLYGSGPGVLALNRMRGPIIADVFPVEPNRPALGLDLSQHPDTVPPAGLRRSLESGRVAIGGPVPLAQGGDGILLFRTGAIDAAGDTLTAEVVVALASLLEGTGVEELAAGLPLRVQTLDGRLVAGTATLPPDPVEIPVDLPEGRWMLSAAPAGGWEAAVRAESWALRVALAVFILLTAVLLLGAVDRDARLTRAVDERTDALRRANERLESSTRELAAQKELRHTAMAAGRVAVWSWDMTTDEIERAGGIDPNSGVPEHDSIDGLLRRIHPRDRPLLERAVVEARHSGQLSVEFRERTTGSEYAWLKVEGRATEHAGERPVRMLGARVDISDLKRLEAELLHHDRVELIGQLAGGVVHDINNALAVVLGELEVALDAVDSPADSELAMAARESHNAARYASLLTNQLLTFARKGRVDPTIFLWDSMCEDAIGFLGRLLGNGVKVFTHFDAVDSRVRMDRTQAMQILANLCTNARDAMGGRGRLDIVTRTIPDAASLTPEATPGAAVVTEIRDTGPGIPEQVRDNVFEPFYTTKGKDHGTGLGLSTSRRIAREAGGDLFFETSTEGTTFYVVLPLCSMPTRPSTRSRVRSGR